jgi:hypothetical protein
LPRNQKRLPAFAGPGFYKTDEKILACSLQNESPVPALPRHFTVLGCYKLLEEEVVGLATTDEEMRSATLSTMC